MNGDTKPIAVVTGASRGIGATTARWLALNGWRVAICGRDSAKLAEVGNDIQNHTDAQVLSRVLDISKSQEVVTFADEVSEEWGNVSTLICNAAILGPIGSISSLDPSKMKDAVDINVIGTFNSIWAFSKHLFSQDNSRVVVVAGGGLGGASPLGGAYGYVPSKAYCVLLVELLAREFATHKAAICSIAPGLVATGFMKSALSESSTDIPIDLVEAAHAQQRIANDDDVLDPYFRLLARFLSVEGVLMNGRLLSSRWDQCVNLAEMTERSPDSMFRLRRIDDSLFMPAHLRKPSNQILEDSGEI